MAIISGLRAVPTVQKPPVDEDDFATKIGRFWTVTVEPSFDFSNWRNRLAELQPGP